LKVLYVPHCLRIGLNVGYSPQSAIICPSHVKRENTQRIDVAALLIHPGARSLRHALTALLSRKTLGSHCAAVCVSTGTRTESSEKFRLLCGCWLDQLYQGKNYTTKCSLKPMLFFVLYFYNLWEM